MQCVLAQSLAAGHPYCTNVSRLLVAVCPGEASSIYVASPNVFRPATLQFDVDLLKGAFAGCGTDEDKVVRVLCNREHSRTQQA